LESIELYEHVHRGERDHTCTGRDSRDLEMRGEDRSGDKGCPFVGSHVEDLEALCCCAMTFLTSLTDLLTPIPAQAPSLATSLVDVQSLLRSSV
jgi:hypothetical protein